MSGRANVCQATDHRATVRLGYCPIGLLSCRVTVSRLLSLGPMLGRAVVRRATVLLGYCLSGLCPRVSVRRANVLSG